MLHANISLKRILHFLLLCFSLFSAVAVLWLCMGALRNPTRSFHAVVGSMVWMTFGPHLMLLSAFSLLSAGLGLRLRRGVFGSGVLILSALALLGSSVINARIVSRVVKSGGSVNPVKGLFLKPMVAAGPDESLRFREVDGQDLFVAVYKPRERRGLSPVLMYIHGGGFMTGSNIETDADLRWFADQGWLVFSVEYRLFTPEVPTWDKAPADVACALAWVGRYAEHFQGDLTRLAVLGDSAGGNLALNLSYAAAQGRLETDCGPLPVPSAVVVQYPAVDPQAIYHEGFPIPGFEPRMLVSGYIGGAPGEFPDRVRAVSSATHISAAAPPTLILAPEKDSIVPFTSVSRFAEEARSAGVLLEMIPLPFANHVYNQLAWGAIGNQARRSLTRRFLTEHGLAPDS